MFIGRHCPRIATANNLGLRKSCQLLFPDLGVVASHPYKQLGNIPVAHESVCIHDYQKLLNVPELLSNQFDDEDKTCRVAAMCENGQMALMVHHHANV
ncbi:hypothetical protein MRX96_014654 [Rhipicephalus microplus]